MTTTNDQLAKREEIFSAPSGYRSLISAVDCTFAAILITIVLFATGCSSDGGGLADSGGMSGTGVSQGAVSSFGSVFVNGVRWDLSSATIEIDGVVASESDLRVGMVVRVEGDFAAGNSDGTATRVTFEDVLEGPIEDAPVETVPGMIKTFTILGQTVAVDALDHLRRRCGVRQPRSR